MKNHLAYRGNGAVLSCCPIKKEVTMKLIVQFSNGNHLNISVDRIEREDSFVVAYRGDALMGVIDLASIDYLYLSEVKG